MAACRRFANFLTIALCLAIAQANAAWPEKPVRIVVAAPGGSSVDIVARVIADGLRPRLGQAVIVDNKPAAGGTAAATEVAKASADGYTLLLGFNGPLSNAPALYPQLPYRPLDDFAPLILTGSQPNVLVVHAGVPAATLADFIALARAQPGKLNYASVGNGSSSHLSMELLKRRATIDLTHIPFNGGPPAIQAIVAGDVQALFTAPANVIAQIRAGTLRALAVTSLKRFADLPNVPTIAEAHIDGLAAFEAIAWNGLLAPAATPRSVIERLNAEVNAVLKDPSAVKRLRTAGIEPGGGSTADFGRWIAAETRKWTPIIQATGARVD
jgi:tripartite-type tricarboxylate transporter receptor subunit TctC